MTTLFDCIPDSGTVHVVMPNMATACAESVLTMRDQGDRMIYNHRTRWNEVTCPWCHSLGIETIAAISAAMQARPATITA